MRSFRLSLILLACLTASPSAFAIVPSQPQPIAVLRALDKITARVEQLEVPVDQPLKFGALIINVRTCKVTLPEESPPEAAAFMDISEFKPGQDDVPVFDGWMFASSPALSPFQHPVYDIWLIGCEAAKNAPVTK